MHFKSYVRVQSCATKNKVSNVCISKPDRTAELYIYMYIRERVRERERMDNLGSSGKSQEPRQLLRFTLDVNKASPTTDTAERSLDLGVWF